MTVAIIIAGGKGKRARQPVPKQFISVNDKPILVHTLECFQNHPGIDAIEVVCLSGWSKPMRAYVLQFGLDKVKWITTGGETVQDSIHIGVQNLAKTCGADDTVIIHDGVRPFVEPGLLNDLLRVCGEKGNAVTSQPFTEQIFLVGDDKTTTREHIPRATVRRIQTPQAYRYGRLAQVYEEAFAKDIGLEDGSYANTTMVQFGETLHLSKGMNNNIKITTATDIELFKVLLKDREKRKAEKEAAAK